MTHFSNSVTAGQLSHRPVAECDLCDGTVVGLGTHPQRVSTLEGRCEAPGQLAVPQRAVLGRGCSCLQVSKAGAGLGAVWERRACRGRSPGDRPGSDCRSGPRALIGHPAWLPTEIQENAISPSDMSRVQEAVLHSRHAELKDRLRGLSQGYDRLRRVSHQGYGAEAGEPSAGTRASRSVPSLWRSHTSLPVRRGPLAGDVRYRPLHTRAGFHQRFLLERRVHEARGPVFGSRPWLAGPGGCGPGAQG